MLDIVDNNIFLTRGDSAIIPLTITLGDEEYDYSNDYVQFTVKRNTVTETIIIQKTINNGGFKILPSDTNELEYQAFQYDVQLIKPNGDVFTVIPPHDFVLMPEVNFSSTIEDVL